MLSYILEDDRLALHAAPASTSLGDVSDAEKPFEFLDGACAEPGLCPLSRMAEGTEVCIRQLMASPEVRTRLRELGLGEQQRIKIVSRQANFICQVCNARLGISEEVAQAIWVEPILENPSPLSDHA
ncbi:MAG: FeoA family protein [Verrucomicrobiota bacterium]|nr:ferrous iron transport protein A [Limisphaera sp.]MDW8381631.1 FeoA family protein [Verrucomicrobiota bacterium]